LEQKLPYTREIKFNFEKRIIGVISLVEKPKTGAKTAVLHRNSGFNMKHTAPLHA